MPDTPPTATPFTSRLLTPARENSGQVRWIGAVVGIFLLIYFLPAGTARFDNAVLEGIRLTHWYAQEHVPPLLPAFLIAGAMAAYLSQGAVMRYLGPSAPKPVAFGMAVMATANAQQAAEALGLTVEIEKVTDMNAIIDKGVMRIPALGIDGKVASPDELETLFKG